MNLGLGITADSSSDLKQMGVLLLPNQVEGGICSTLTQDNVIICILKSRLEVGSGQEPSNVKEIYFQCV